MTRRNMMYAAGAALLVILIAVGTLAARSGRHRVSGVGATTASKAALPDDGRAPEGVRIRVEVINTTKTRGLARRATEMLRDLGYDVVEVGTAGPVRAHSIVIARTGHADWMQLLAKAVHADTATQADPARFVDLSLLLGSDWSPPTQPLYP